jgi:activator of HSP90 ATPase
MIHQGVTLPASPDEVYAVLVDGARFTAATGNREATIGSGEGAAFSLFGGGITGRHVELAPGKLLVQAWRAGNWPAGHYSIVRFALAADGKGTRLVIDHTGYPEGEHAHLVAGWPANYFEPLTKYLGA